MAGGSRGAAATLHRADEGERGMLRQGDRIADWIVDALLGEGAMGAVYRVHSALSGRAAALKVLKPSLESDARALFIREAEAVSALRHPAIVQVMGFHEDRARGLLCLVMELAEGDTLGRHLAQGPMGLADALSTFVPLASALDHAHAQGIFHRDLKPSNLILCADGPRLVDFGIASVMGEIALDTEGQMGTLAYLPPEVFRGERAGPAAMDVYAFGLLLFEALTGERGFASPAGATPEEAARSIGDRKLEQRVFDPGESFPARLRDAVLQATDPDPARRPTMRALRSFLESLLERRGAAPTDRDDVLPALPATGTPEDATVYIPNPPSTGGGRLRLGLTMLAVVMAMVAAALVIWS
jgi:eukaryotic-like serine/threonine-protein kinase